MSKMDSNLLQGHVLPSDITGGNQNNKLNSEILKSIAGNSGDFNDSSINQEQGGGLTASQLE